MLQTIGKHIQGWIAGVVVVIIAAAFVLFGLEYYISSGGNQQAAAATVNGAKITVKQLDNTYDALQRNYTQKGAVLNEQAQQQLRYLALQQLILDQVLLQTVDKMGFSINTAEIQQEILRIPAFQENGQFSAQRFNQLLRSNGIASNTFIQNVKESLLISQLSTGIQNSSFILPDELAQAYGLLHQQRSFGFFTLPSAHFVAGERPTEEQISAYFQQHPEQFRTPAQVKVAYLLLSPDSLKPEITVSLNDIQQFYQENASQFGGKSLEQVKANIEQRLYQQKLNQILAGKSEQLENLTYTNPASLEDAAKSLGLPVQTTGWMSREGIKGDSLFSDPKVLAAVFSDEVMKQNNNSQPVELKNGGLVVVRIAEQQPSQNQTLAAVHDSIQQQLQKEQAQKQAGLQAYNIQQALLAGESIDSVAKRNHLTWVVKTNITRQDKTLSPQLLTAVFNLTPNADPAKKAVTTSVQANGDYVILQLDSVHNADYSQAPAAEREKLRAELTRRWGELEYQFFAKSALDSAKIK